MVITRYWKLGAAVVGAFVAAIVSQVTGVPDGTLLMEAINWGQALTTALGAGAVTYIAPANTP